MANVDHEKRQVGGIGDSGFFDIHEVFQAPVLLGAACVLRVRRLALWMGPFSASPLKSRSFLPLSSLLHARTPFPHRWRCSPVPGWACSRSLFCSRVAELLLHITALLLPLSFLPLPVPILLSPVSNYLLTYAPQLHHCMLPLPIQMTSPTTLAALPRVPLPHSNDRLAGLVFCPRGKSVCPSHSGQT